MPRMYDVSSSTINSVGYEDGNLYVEFSRGRTTYVYYDVSELTYKGLLFSDHAGEYLAEHVKKAGYRFDKLG